MNFESKNVEERKQFEQKNSSTKKFEQNNILCNEFKSQSVIFEIMLINSHNFVTIQLMTSPT